MELYNIMQCTGPSWETFAILGDCSFAWFSFAITLFLALVARRQCDDGFLSGTPFNLIGALVLGLGANLLVITLMGSPRFSLVAGVVGVIAGGYLGGMVLGSSEGEY